MRKLIANIDPGFEDLIDPGFEDLTINRTGLEESQLQSVVGFFFIIAGMIAVIMIIIGAYWYILSAGDPQKVKKAKDTILYAVVGLIISISAWAIIEFIIG